MIVLLGIVVATFVSEDLTCISAGVLVHQGELSLSTALAGCYLGILVGDLGLWILGRCLAETVLKWSFVQRRLPVRNMDALAERLNRHAGKVVFAARFLPGTRFPVYVAAGAVRGSGKRFLIWAALAGLLWTPILVGISALFGAAVTGPLQTALRGAVPAVVATVLVAFLAIRTLMLMATAVGRARLIARVSRVWRWEFWPTWLFYMPLVPWIGWLALRKGGLRTITAANPGIPQGGIVGESKCDILRHLPSEWVVPSERIDATVPAERMAAFRRLLEPGSAVGGLPLILKPDSGERGAGVRLVRDTSRAEEYLAAGAWPVLVQAYHPGPYEAGIFYCRMPEQQSGRIFSITDKVFAAVTGNGRSTVEELIWRHPRYRMQARTFLARLNGRANWVPERDETVRLVEAGNHCQGAMFRDGSHLWSAELEARIDDIARGFEGFHFGRFDVRYRDPVELRAGRGFAVIELNGAMSESTNIYDPDGSLVAAYRTLYRQWRILFEIGRANRSRGQAASSWSEIRAMLRRHYTGRHVPALSD